MRTFRPVQPGWKVQFGPDADPKASWLPLLGWFVQSEGTAQPAVWWGGLVTAESAADALEHTEWSVVELEYDG